MIDINIIYKNKIETIKVNKDCYTDDIYNKINKNTNFLLSYDGNILKKGILIKNYNISNGHNIIYNGSEDGDIKLTIIMNKNDKREVYVFADDYLYTLSDKLGIQNPKNLNLKVIVNNETYPLASIFTFRELGITRDSNIVILFSPVVSG